MFEVSFWGGQGYIFYFLLIISVTWSDSLLTEFFILILLLPFMLFIIELFKKDSAIIDTGFTVLAFMYVTIPCVLLTKIVSSGYNAGGYFPQKVLGMIFFVWINDTGAYLVGSFFGKHKLFERISPNKTWEGTLGGIGLCIALSFVFCAIDWFRTWFQNVLLKFLEISYFLFDCFPSVIKLLN